MRLFDKRIISHFDYLLILFVLPLIYLSYHLISETNEILANKQLIYFTLSFFAFIIVFILPIRKKLRLIPFLYWLGILLLLAVEFWGVTKLGAKRWLPLPILNTTMQPSELIKPIYILMLGYLIHNRPPPKNGYRFSDFAYFSFYILLPFILIAKEPDLGTALVLLLVGYGILFIVGVNWKIWTSIILVIGISSPFIYTYLIKDYQKKRIKDFILPLLLLTLVLVVSGYVHKTSDFSENKTKSILETIDSKNINFFVTHGHCSTPFTGVLEDLKIDMPIRMDLGNPLENLKISFAVNPDSFIVCSGDDDLTKKIKTPGVFVSDNNDQIIFKSTNIFTMGIDWYQINGKISIKGVQRDVKLFATGIRNYNESNTKFLVLEGQMNLLDWGIDYDKIVNGNSENISTKWMHMNMKIDVLTAISNSNNFNF